jgi:nicotinate-nucleotide adenylyltransferase
MRHVEKTIVLYGGTFHPFHSGHRQMILSCFNELNPDEIWIIPAGIPPHKKMYDEIPSDDRIQIIRRSVFDLPYVRILDLECRRPEKSYTYETLRFLSEKYPSYHFVFLIGEDSLDSFDRWKNPDVIAELCSFAVCIRSDSDRESFRKKCLFQSQKYNTRFQPLGMKPVDISSTVLRDYLAEDNPKASEYIAEYAYKYIKEHHLYEKRADYIMTIEEIEEDLKKKLKPQRYEHTLGVMYTASALAMRYSCPVDKAMYAGLLHDCAKYMSAEQLLSFSHANGIEIKEQERESPHLLHAKVGAYLAGSLYKIDDPEICHAISVHTTGCPNMNLLDKIIFTADYIEPGRTKAVNLPEIRKQSFMNIDLAICMILRDTLLYLQNKGAEIDDTTEKTYEFYKNINDSAMRKL